MPPNRKAHCYDDLRKRILSLDIAPGEDLDELSLTDHYNMSRTPLREVLQRLSGDGYVQQQENRGTKVAPLDLPTLRIFFQTAPMIYANISRLAAENRSLEQLHTLKNIQHNFKTATNAQDASAASLLNYRFHKTIGEMAHNPYLVASLNRMLIDHTRLGHTFYQPTSDDEHHLVEKAVDQHDALIAAIEACNDVDAVEITLRHWDLSRTRMERFVRPDPLPIDVLPLKENAHAV